MFFSRSASEESQCKSFSKNDRANSKISRKLIKHSKEEIKNTNLPVFQFSSKAQSGENFSERFSNAITSVFDKGFENVIAIGNDCPLLDSNDIISAYKLLLAGNNVLGPSTDGGIYLLGIKKSEFDIDIFQKLKWQESTLFLDIQKYFQNEGSKVCLLAEKQDIDKEADLLSLFRSYSQLNIVVALKEIYLENPILRINHQLEQNSCHTFLESLGMRGPPFNVV